MAPHVKPTPEELKEQARLAVEEAERLSNEPEKDEEEAEPSKPQEDTPEETPEEEPKKEEKKPVEEAEPSEEEKAQLKKKLSASARENQKILAKNRVINNALSEADDIPEPTEEDLAKEYKEWEVMTETEKMLAKETLVTKQWRAKISEAKQQTAKIEKWNESVDSFIDDPKTLIDTPSLEGKTDEFKEFASQDENNNVPMKVLVSAFLHEQSTKKVEHKGAMFVPGNGGPNENPRPQEEKLTLEQSRKLRETNYTEWKEKLAAGKISSSI